MDAIDLYNFNKNQSDIETGNPDNHNGRFQELGWAKQFFSRGQHQLDSIPIGGLGCCEDNDCSEDNGYVGNEFTCTCHECVVRCPVTQRSGGKGWFTFAIDVKATQGVIAISYDMYDIPDALTLYYGNDEIFSTEYLVSGRLSTTVEFGSDTSTSTIVTAHLEAPNDGTAWKLSIGCAATSP